MYIFTIHCWLLLWLVMALHIDIDGLVQDCSNSSALGVELLQSWAKASIWPNHTTDKHCACRWFSTYSHQAISRYSAGYKVSIFYLAFNNAFMMFKLITTQYSKHLCATNTLIRYPKIPRNWGLSILLHIKFHEPVARCLKLPVAHVPGMPGLFYAFTTG